MHESGSDNSSQIYGHSKFSKMAASCHLGFSPTGSRSIRSAVPEKPTLESNTKSIGRPVRRYGNLKFSKMAARRHLGFGETGNSAIRSAGLENPTLEPNMKWIGWPVAEIWPFEISQNARSVGRRVGRSVGPQYYLVLIHSSTLR